MAQPTRSDEEIRSILYNALGTWRTRELSFIRRRALDIEDKIEALENKTLQPHPDRAALKSRLEELAARYAERKDKRIAMIEQTYEMMIDFVDRHASEAA